MPTKLAIFAKSSDLAEIARFLRDDVPLKCSVTGPDEGWETISLSAGGIEMRLSQCQFTGPGDPFSHRILGAINFVRNIRTEHATSKQLILDKIKLTKVIIGCVISAEEPDEIFAMIVQLLANHADGFVFTGSEIYLNDGRLALDIQGSSQLDA